VATAELTVIPIGREGASTGDVMADLQRRLAAQDRVDFRMRAMGTELEGSVEDILELVRELHTSSFEAGVPRVYTVLKLDERRDREQSLDEKVRSVERRLREEGVDPGDYPPGD
jgi:uncharacterized protein (TIGR00106 family)